MNEAQVWIIGKQPYRKKQSAVTVIDFHCIDICSEAKKQKKGRKPTKTAEFSQCYSFMHIYEYNVLTVT